MEEKIRVIISEEEIAARVRELAGEIQTAYEGIDVIVVGLLEDSFIFLADLIRAIDKPLQSCFLKATVHQTGGHTDIVYTTEFDPHGSNVLLVGGVLDTGVTLDYLERQLVARGAKSVKACVLVDKPSYRTTELAPEFVGFTRDEERIFGYGLGISNSYRQLRYLAVFDAP